MYQGKFDSKNKRTTVDVSQLVAQRNSAPSQEQPPRQQQISRAEPTLPGRSSLPVSQVRGRVSPLPVSPAESGRPRPRPCRKNAAKAPGWAA